MNPQNFDSAYFKKTLRKRATNLGLSIPSTYLAYLIILFSLLQIVEVTSIITWTVIGIGFFLKLGLHLWNKKAFSKTNILSYFIDSLFAYFILANTSYTWEIMIVFLVLLYLLYYAVLMTVSYSNLSFTSFETIKELQVRHTSTPKKYRK